MVSETPYQDMWKIHIPDNKLNAYKQMLDEGCIWNPHVVYDRSTGTTTVEYYASMPHEQVRNELRRRSAS